MKILMMAINDPAGTAIQMCKALNAYTDHTARLVTLETRYTHSWEKDLHLPDMGDAELEELRDLFVGSDVFHFHMTCDEFQPFGPFIPADYLEGKMIVHHHHGHHDFRSNPKSFSEKYARLGRTNLLVSTPDLLKLLPEARWQPNFVPVNDPDFMPYSGDKGADQLLVAHSPTRKDLKNTDDLLAVYETLRQEKQLGVQLDLIDDVPNLECLQRKQKCHVLFDHMQGYYGVSSLEGLSQGLAVIAGVDEWNKQNIIEFTGTDKLPWVVAKNRQELQDTMEELVCDVEKSLEIGIKSRAFMEDYWSDKHAIGHMNEFYSALA
ncbi:MAG: glycosyltransferase family 1 protein [Desulfovibrio sp.]